MNRDNHHNYLTNCDHNSIYDYPVLNNIDFGKLQEKIKERCQIIQDGKKYRRELFGLMRQAENVNFQERFDTVKNLIQDYDNCLLLVKKHRENYQKFVDQLIQYLQTNFLQEIESLLEKEQKRQEMEQRFQTDNLVSALKNKHKQQILKFLFRLGRIALLSLAKIDLLNKRINALIQANQSQQKLGDRLKKQVNEYDEFYQFQSEFQQKENQALIKLQNIVNFEAHLSPILGDFQSLTNQLLNIDGQLQQIVKDLDSLDRNFPDLDSEDLLRLESDQISYQLIKLLITNQFSQQKLILALKDSPTQDINLDQFSLINDLPSLIKTIQTFQDYLTQNFQKYQGNSLKLTSNNQPINQNNSNSNSSLPEVNSQSIPLISKSGINYKILEELLSQNKWKEADFETYKLMIQVLNKKEGDNIYQEELLNFPSEDFLIIDQLWMKHSQGRFGFTKQKEIWLDCGGKTEVYEDNIAQIFGDRVGWKRRNSWLNYNDLSFNLQAPFGHLPIIRVQYGGKSILFSRKIIYIIAQKVGKNN